VMHSYEKLHFKNVYFHLYNMAPKVRLGDEDIMSNKICLKLLFIKVILKVLSVVLTYQTVNHSSFYY
jgi:hypothetical protein